MAKLNDIEGLDESDSAGEAKVYLELIDSMRSDESLFNFADDTLQGIYDYIKERNYVSQGQKKAVENILSSKGKTLEDYF